MTSRVPIRLSDSCDSGRLPPHVPPRTSRHRQRESAAASGPAYPRFLREAIFITVVALCVRVLYIWQLRPSPFFDVLIGDARRYDEWARQIAAGDWLGRDVFYQAPLYPYFLGGLYVAVGHDLLAVRLVQAAIGTASCVMLALATRRLHSDAAGVLAGLGLALYPPAVFFDALLQKSVLDVFFVAVLIWLVSARSEDVSSGWRWFCVGLTLGALALTRENALILVVPVVIWLWFSRANRTVAARLLMALIVGASIVLLPVAARNRVVGGEWHLTTSQFGPNFYLGNNASTDGTAGALREGRGSVGYERQDAIDLAQAAEGRPLTAGEVSSYWTRQAVSFISSHPWNWIKLLGRKVILLLNRSELVDTESQESYAEWSPTLRALSHVMHFGVLAPLAGLGVLAGWSSRRRLLLLYAMAATYAVTVVMFFVSARYRLPLVPFLMIFAAMGLSSLPAFFQRADKRTKSAVAVIVCLTATVANWPMWPSGTMAAVTENNLATAFQEEKRFSDAERHYRRALELKPDYAPVYVNLGDVLLAQQRSAEAVEAYLRAGTLGVVDPQLDGRIADAFLRFGKPDQAVDFYRRALSSGDRSSQTYNNLILALIQSDRMDEAIKVFPEALQLDPNNATLHFAYASALLDSGRHGEATGEFNRAVALNPDLISARRDLELASQVRRGK